MARPIPVSSKMQPSSTKTGTDSKISDDMPSSIRPIITKTGEWLAKVR